MKTKEDFINGSNLEFLDLDDEEYRVYEFVDMAIKIDNPLKLNVSNSGGHRVWDAKGISHYIPSGWKHLYWLVKKGEQHFAF